VKPGDLVRLTAGGPTMTVERIHTDGNAVTCVWFDEIIGEKSAGWGKMNREKFDAEIIEPVGDESAVDVH
jgi:uncharacterized protein YodC (DUF2158 family)